MADACSEFHGCRQRNRRVSLSVESFRARYNSMQRNVWCSALLDKLVTQSLMQCTARNKSNSMICAVHYSIQQQLNGWCSALLDTRATQWLVQCTTRYKSNSMVDAVTTRYKSNSMVGAVHCAIKEQRNGWCRALLNSRVTRWRVHQ